MKWSLNRRSLTHEDNGLREGYADDAHNDGTYINNNNNNNKCTGVQNPRTNTTDTRTVKHNKA